MKARQFVFGAMLCLALVASANAGTRVTTLGSVNDGDFGFVANIFFGNRTFNDTINFTLTQTATISGFILPINLVGSGFSLASTAATIFSSPLTAATTYSFADLAPGTYSFSIFGTTRFIGGYAATYRVAVAAVPEMETWLMLIIGVGLVAYQLHRKQKALGLQTLRDESATPA
jgi:hypothetical protein